MAEPLVSHNIFHIIYIYIKHSFDQSWATKQTSTPIGAAEQHAPLSRALMRAHHGINPLRPPHHGGLGRSWPSSGRRQCRFAGALPAGDGWQTDATKKENCYMRLYRRLHPTVRRAHDAKLKRIRYSMRSPWAHIARNLSFAGKRNLVVVCPDGFAVVLKTLGLSTKSKLNLSAHVYVLQLF